MKDWWPELVTTWAKPIVLVSQVIVRPFSGMGTFRQYAELSSWCGMGFPRKSAASQQWNQYGTGTERKQLQWKKISGTRVLTRIGQQLELGIQSKEMASM